MVHFKVRPFQLGLLVMGLIHSFSYRKSLVASVAFCLVIAACQSAQKGELPTQLAVMQGLTGTDFTQLIVLVDKNEQIDFEIENLGAIEAVEAVKIEQKVLEWPGSNKMLLQLSLTGLDQKATYLLRLKNRDNKLLDTRSFRTLTTPDQSLRIAIASCMDDASLGESQIWSELNALKPQLIWMIGDNVYGDWQNGRPLGAPSPDVLWQRFVETREKLSIFREFALTPIFAIWDDHDYGINDGDQTNPSRIKALEIFQALFGRPKNNAQVSKGFGAGYSVEVNDHRFIFLDGRSFRSPNQRPPICKKVPDHFACKKPSRLTRGPDADITHLGRDQNEWLFDQLRQAKSSNQLAWLIKGDQFFGGYHPFESFEGSHPKDFAAFLKRLKASNYRPLFVSGDRHISEVMQLPSTFIGQTSFELTSSPIHAKVFPSDRKTFGNPLAIEYVAELHNFLVVDTPTQLSDKMTIKVEAYAPEKTKLFSRLLKLSPFKAAP